MKIKKKNSNSFYQHIFTNKHHKQNKGDIDANQ